MIMYALNISFLSFLFEHGLLTKIYRVRSFYYYYFIYYNRRIFHYHYVLEELWRIIQRVTALIVADNAPAKTTVKYTKKRFVLCNVCLGTIWPWVE